MTVRIHISTPSVRQHVYLVFSLGWHQSPAGLLGIWNHDIPAGVHAGDDCDVDVSKLFYLDPTTMETIPGEVGVST